MIYLQTLKKISHFNHQNQGGLCRNHFCTCDMGSGLNVTEVRSHSRSVGDIVKWQLSH